MRIADAPPAGWYPDPEHGGVRLRWWDGTDWSDRYRARPGPAEIELWSKGAGSTQLPPGVPAPMAGQRDMGGLNRAAAEEVISQVRQVARSEVDRAIGMVADRAYTARREIEPLITQYTNKVLRWLRIFAILIVVVLVAWIAFQVIADITFFEWLGDRIDNLTDDG